ncbi:MAG: hypothetical protein H7Y38_01860 [Armatimonadetes bacterium]|nr:hypothetical protein [Armatimonadota bacterium]
MNTNIISGALFAAVIALSAPVFAQGTVVTDDKTQTTVTAPANGKTEVRTAPNGDTVITVTVDDAPVVFAATSRPRMVGGRVLVPLRGVVEKLGGDIQYDPLTKVISGAQASKSMQFRLRVGSSEALLNGNATSMDSKPLIVNGITYVPLRFVSEAMGAQVVWDAARRTVVIAASGNVAVVKTGTM